VDLLPNRLGRLRGWQHHRARFRSRLYGILDLLAKPVFGAILLWGHRNIDPARLGLRIKDVTEGPVYPEGPGAQKRSVNEPAAGTGANSTQNPADVPVTGTTAA
jgi:hypothetical protein